uniref:Uncharacterized protein n=1 Tax=Romanomermis culicivorax TaxID=13658 RepID=A0A915JA80_ROMCU
MAKIDRNFASILWSDQRKTNSKIHGVNLVFHKKQTKKNFPILRAEERFRMTLKISRQAKKCPSK